MLIRVGSFMGAAKGSGEAGSAASALLSRWADANGGLAIDFTDLSMVITDPVTSANNFNGNPNSKLAITSDPKWILNSSGAYVQTSANTLATDHNTSGERLGALIEEARTPLAARSRRLDDASYWTATNVTTSTVQGVDGVSGSATRITSTAGNATIIGTANTSALAARRLSPFIRRVSGTGNLEYTLDNGGTWTAFTAPSSSFARFDVGATVTNPRVGFRIVSSGDSFDIDFAGGETGAFATSPIESGTSPTARAADNVSLATSQFPYVQTDLTAYFKARALTVLAGNALFQGAIGAPALANRDANNFLRSSLPSVAYLASASGELSTSAATNVAAAYKAGDHAICSNGGAVGTSSNATAMTLPSTIFIGRAASGLTNILNGHIAQMMLLPRRMSNADLQALTT